MNLLAQAITDNQILLSELAQLLSNITQSKPKLYAEPHPLLNSKDSEQKNYLGSHVRHLLEHYQILLAALEQDVPINYDQRQRSGECQICVESAIQTIQLIVEQLNQLPNDDQRVAVSLITNPALADMVSKSSLLREMQFLQSHTVHHLALIGLVLRQEGFDVAGNLTKAASTLQFENH